MVRMTGQIVSGEWALWKKMVASINRHQDTLFILQSPGGDGAHGLFLLGHVEEFLKDQRAAGLRVAVFAVKDCSSMCVPLFYTFEERLSLPDTRIGLHAVHDLLGANPAFTQSYLDKMRAIARTRGDQETLRWLAEKELSGAFATPILDENRASDLAAGHSGIINETGIVETIEGTIERFERGPEIHGMDISWTHPGYKAVIAKIWGFVSQELARLDQSKIRPPALYLEPFVHTQQSEGFTRWQSEWIVNHASVWLEWTNIDDVPKEQITPEWIRERLDKIYPFPATFRGFHYDGTNVIQVNPEVTFKSMVTPDQNHTSFRDYVGYGYYVTGHELAHYALAQRGIPDKLHHCIYLISVEGKPSLMRRLNDFLISEKIAGIFLSRYGLDQELSFSPCANLTPDENRQAARAAQELAPR